MLVGYLFLRLSYEQRPTSLMDNLWQDEIRAVRDYHDKYIFFDEHLENDFINDCHCGYF